MKIRKTLKIFKIILLSALLIFSVFTLSGRFFGIKYYNVTTSSMHPTIPKNSLVYIKELKTEEVLEKVKEGNTVAIDAGGEIPLMHRIVEIKGNIITTKGDANEDDDDPITYDQIQGVVIFSIPFMGILKPFFASFFTSIYPFLILLCVVLLYFGIKYLIKELKNK